MFEEKPVNAKMNVSENLVRIAMLSGAQLRVLNVEVTNGIHSTGL